MSQVLGVGYRERPGLTGLPSAHEIYISCIHDFKYEAASEWSDIVIIRRNLRTIDFESTYHARNATVSLIRLTVLLKRILLMYVYRSSDLFKRPRGLDPIQMKLTRLAFPQGRSNHHIVRSNNSALLAQCWTSTLGGGVTDYLL